MKIAQLEGLTINIYKFVKDLENLHIGNCTYSHRGSDWDCSDIVNDCVFEPIVNMPDHIASIPDIFGDRLDKVDNEIKIHSSSL